MRHGRMVWSEDELSAAVVTDRQERLRAAMASEGLDAMLLYTNMVRPAAVTWATGFTPYWADAILAIPRSDGPLMATTLSKRVGNWIAGMNPTSEIVHSPNPGKALGERLAAVGVGRIGVVELDRLPGGLGAEIVAAADVELIDATALFTNVRGRPDAAETGLVGKADLIASQSLAIVDPNVQTTGEVTATAERETRLAGAEECYVAIAPDLSEDERLARFGGDTPIGRRFALRLSVAYNGTWIRRTETFDRSTDFAAPRNWFDRLAAGLDLSKYLATQIADAEPPEGFDLAEWFLEAPFATRPLKYVIGPDKASTEPLPYGILTVRLTSDNGPWVASRPVVAYEGTNGQGIAG